MAQLPNPTILSSSQDLEDLRRRIGLAIAILQEPGLRPNARGLAISALVGVPVGGAVLLTARDITRSELIISA